MPPKAAAPKGGDPTPIESRFFRSMILNMEKPETIVDWSAVAAENGYKNDAVAKKRFQQIIKDARAQRANKNAETAIAEVKDGEPETEEPAMPTVKPAAKGKNTGVAAAGKKRGKASEAAEEEEDAGAKKEPVRKTKRVKKEPKVEVSEEQGSMEEDEDDA